MPSVTGEELWGDDAIVSIVLRVQAIGAPELLARTQIMAGHDIASGQDDLTLAIVLEKRGGDVGVRGFADRVREAFHSPYCLAGRGIDLQEIRGIVGLHPVEHRQIECALEQERR